MNIRQHILSLRPKLMALVAVGLLAFTSLQPAEHAHAQSNDWMQWDTEPRRPAPRQRRATPRRAQPSQAPRRYQQQTRSNLSPRQRQYCARLERELADDYIAGQRASTGLPELRQQIAKASRTARGLERQLERRQCYEQFFFSRTLRNTPRCVKLDRNFRQARGQLQRLQGAASRVQRAAGGRQRQDELIRELARYNCGDNYVREARRRQPNFFPFWQDQDTQDNRRGELAFANPGFETYRTMCVRSCDGYYFPVSFSTMRGNFAKDANVCANKCAAPAQLFIYRNPGEEVDQMRSLEGQPYSKMPNAFRYRREYVKGCSCNAREYGVVDSPAASDAAKPGVPQGSASEPATAPGQKPAETAPNAQRPTTPERRVDAQQAPQPTAVPRAQSQARQLQ